MGDKHQRPFRTDCGLTRSLTQSNAHRDHMMMRVFGGSVRIVRSGEKIATDKPPPVITQSRQESRPALV